MLKTLITMLFLSFDMETGWIPTSASSTYTPPHTSNYKITYDNFYLSMKPRAEFKGFFVNMDLTYFAQAPKKGIIFNPYQWRCQNGLGYSYSYFTIGYNHMCHHSIVPTNEYSFYDINLNDGARDVIYIKVSFTNKRVYKE